MTTGTVPGAVHTIVNNRVLTRAPAGRQTAVSGDLSFSQALRRATVSSGSADLDAIFDAAGQRYNIDPNLLRAVAQVESNFRPNVTSRSGAMGIMQLMPGTARYLGVTDAFDPEQNIMGGARYLREQLDRFNGDVRLALAAYNAGWPAVQRYGGIPPFRETQNYVPRVLEIYGAGDITAGTVTYGGGFDISDRLVERSSGSFDFSAALTQMLFLRLIEMQMSSPGDRSSRNMFF